MFYNHEFLTNRQHGVATIWLVATLGSRSNLRTVSRKAIAGINIPKACETITNPEAPLALRLQASLLYGVSRVYSHQCRYMLNDMYSFKNKIIEGSLPDSRLEIDPHIGKMRPEHLNLPEDPLFSPELDLNFDLSAFDGLLHHPPALQERSATDFPSTPEHYEPVPSGSSHGSNKRHNAGHVDYVQPSLIAPSSSLARKSTVCAEAGSNVIEEEPPIIDDPGFEIADDGSIMPLLLPRHGDPFYLELVPSADSVIGRTGNANHGDNGGGGGGMMDDQAGNGFDDENRHMLFDDFDPLLPTARPFSPLPPGLNSEEPGRQPHEDDSFLHAGSTSTTTATANAPQQRVRRKSKPLQVDAQAELANSELYEWSNNYLANMASATHRKEKRGSVAQAKKSASFWIMGQGIGDVEMLFGQDRIDHPLAIFSGQSLLDALRGKQKHPSPAPAPASQPLLGGSKRPRSHTPDDEDSDQDSRRVRAKAQGRGDDMLHAEDDTRIDFESEIGRHGQSSLPDRPSVMMPWSMSGSRKSSAAALPRMFGSAGGEMAMTGGAGMLPSQTTLSRRGSRLSSASPLLGKGTGGLGRLPSLDLDLGFGLGLGSDVDNFNPDDLGLQFRSEGEQDYDFCDPHPNPNTHPTTTRNDDDTQWRQKVILEDEALNFLDFLDSKIAERGLVDDDDDDGDGEGSWVGQRTGTNSITLDELLPPEENTSVVGAQALLHILSLATKGFVDVEQKEPWEAIRLWVVSEPRGVSPR